jgi:hypothetical protein
VALPVIAVVAVAVALVMPPGNRAADAQTGCRIYVAGGDHIPAGHEVSESERYPEQLLADHLQPVGWCLYNLAQNETTSATYISGGQLANTWNRRPDFITLTIGEENNTIINLVNSCFDKVKDHDFTGANVCAAQILANSRLWSSFRDNLTTIFQQYRMMIAGRPHMVVAITGYPNPYPDALEVTPKIALLCVPLIDTIPTCTIRWAQFPPALVTLDQVFQKLNTTIQEAMAPFQAGPNGYRFVYVDTYTKMRDHCMKMEVEIKTKVTHPEQESVHDHNSPKVNFGCSDPWFVEGDDGTAKPNYLLPASLGILTEWSQTTSGMGTHPNEEGHNCISDLIWEADTLHPGTTPLKWLLGYGERANSNICR